MREGSRRVKLYKAGKLWVACATIMIAGGVALVATSPARSVGAAKATASVLTAPIALSSQALTGDSAAPVVTSKDRNGNDSVDPDNTGSGVTTISDANIADYFDVRDIAGMPKTFEGKNVQLTNGLEDPNKPGQPQFSSGMVMMLANQQIDFTTDFALNLTMHVAWDPKTMGSWLGGDGSALFFEPLSQAQVLATAATGGGLGLTKNAAAQKQTMSFNLSANALGQLGGVQNHWYAYRSTGNNQPLDGLTDMGKDTGFIKTAGSLGYTYDMTYTAATRKLHVATFDVNGQPVKTWDVAITAAQVGQGYTLGVTASTAASHAAYTATFNHYTYTPSGASLALSAQGLPAGTTGPSQKGIKALAGNHVAFYPEGTAKPTVTPTGFPLTSAYAVPAIDGYVLRKTQFIDIAPGDANQVVLNYGQPATTTVRYVDEAGQPLKPAVTLNGFVGDRYTADKTLAGYDYVGLGTDSAPLTGPFTAANQTVTLVFRRPATQLAVRYVDDAGREIQAPTSQDGLIGADYTVTVPTLKDYDYVGLGTGSAPLTGQVAAGLTVTLVYRHKESQLPTPATAGDLTIRYVDEQGNPLQPDVVKAGFVGNRYEVTAPTLTDYDYVGLGADSAALNGQFTVAPQTITLVYKHVQTQGDLTVRYVDGNGDVLQTSTTLTGDLGSKFAVTIPAIAGYHYIGAGKVGSQITGTYTKAPQVVTLVYTRNENKVPTPEPAGDLTIRYVDEKGKTLRPDVVKSGYIGNGYEVTVPAITDYDYVGLGDGSAALKGRFTTTAQTITLVYQHKAIQTPTPVAAGDLTIRYVDEKGKTLRPDVVKAGYVGNGYEVTVPAITDYDYVGLGDGSAALKGRFTTTAQTITLVYQHKAIQTPTPEVAGDLTIRYVDEQGKTLRPDVVKSGFVGNGYGVTAPAIQDYDYVGLGDGSAALKGQFTATAQNITLVYQHKAIQTPTPAAAGDLTIRYVDEQGKTLRPDVVKSGFVGNGYGVTAPAIADYDYIGLGDGSAALKGQFTAAAQTITLVYQHKAIQTPTPELAGDLTIRYVDEQGKTLQPDMVKSGFVGNGYEVTVPAITDYDYVGLGDGSAALKGRFTAVAQTITLVYRHKAIQTPTPAAAGDLTVCCVDENGNPLQPDAVKAGYVGNGYEVTAPAITDYDYVGLGEDSAALAGQFTAAAQTITLVYRRHVTPTTTPTVDPVDPTTGTPGQPSSTGRHGATDNRTSTTGPATKATLPQTGDQRNLLLQALGMLFLGLTSAGVMIDRRRER
ncbi:MucBP domain-containing protein [Lacticaseibacillus daqingensis]|uniref:MucBP domain-containing protein n=1 Tax=Lacticaseibacillus daqingensis TaxID=2486014 RepID=UPI000F775EF6|nr:MucBP domain-containing protein [Lacticaseibacillus daqingensis]